jgi:protein-disulfide isomerase
MKEENNSKFILAIAITLIVSIGFLMFLWTQAGGSNTGTPRTSEELNLEPISDRDHIRGNPEARVAIIDYSDYECPFCKTFHQTAKKVTDEFSDQVMWVYRHFPLDTVHPTARKQAEAAECAGILGGSPAFWDYSDKIYDYTSSNNGLDMNLLPVIAEEVGLDAQEFEACLKTTQPGEKVQADYRSGLQLGVRGTPAVVLLDTTTNVAQFYSGALTYENLKQAVEDMLGVIGNEEPEEVQDTEQDNQVE